MNFCKSCEKIVKEANIDLTKAFWFSIDGVGRHLHVYIMYEALNGSFTKPLCIPCSEKVAKELNKIFEVKE